MRRPFVVVAAACGIPFVTASAQSERSVAGFLGTVVTTPGAFAPMLAPPMLPGGHDGFGAEALYGRFDLVPDLDVRLNAYGAAVRATGLGGRVSVAGLAGYVQPDCPAGIDIGDGEVAELDCDGATMLGASATSRVLTLALLQDEDGSSAQGDDGPGTVTVGLAGEGGYSFATRNRVLDYTNRYWSVNVGVPIAIAAPVGAAQIVPFVTPALTYGHVSEAVGASFNGQVVEREVLSRGGARFLLSGGLALTHPRSRFALQLGARRVFIRDAETAIGLGIGFNGGRPAAPR